MDSESANQPILNPGWMADAIRNRRTVNFFLPDEADGRVIENAIELARWAPNHRLTEPWRFYLIGPKTAEAVARYAAQLEVASKGERAGEVRYQRLKGIPNTLVLTCRRNDDELVQQEDYAACCCAAQNLMLYLWQHGLGVKWTTGAITRDPGFYELVGADRSAEFVVGHFWIGTPKVVTPQKRGNINDVLVRLP
jgi:nitroreductase